MHLFVCLSVLVHCLSVRPHTRLSVRPSSCICLSVRPSFLSPRQAAPTGALRSRSGRKRRCTWLAAQPPWLLGPGRGTRRGGRQAERIRSISLRQVRTGPGRAKKTAKMGPHAAKMAKTAKKTGPHAAKMAKTAKKTGPHADSTLPHPPPPKKAPKWRGAAGMMAARDKHEAAPKTAGHVQAIQRHDVCH
jgi:hypothetical protein